MYAMSANEITKQAPAAQMALLLSCVNVSALFFPKTF